MRMKTLVATCAISLLGACATAKPTTPEPAAAPTPAAGHDHAHGGGPEGAGKGHGAAHGHGAGHGHGTGKTHGAGHAHGHGASGGMMEGMCPMKVPGVAVAASDVDGGASVSFTTTTGDVNELRARVRRMAEKHEHMGDKHRAGDGKPHQGHDKAATGGPDHAGGKHGMMHGCMMGKPGGMHAATMTVEDIEGGARVILKPRDAAELQALRAHVQKCRERMQSGECPTMGGHAGAPGAAPPAQ
jgi:hypothetical protein